MVLGYSETIRRKNTMARSKQPSPNSGSGSDGREINGLWLPGDLVDILEQTAKEAAGKPLESGPDSPLARLIGAFVERSLDAEMTEHLVYDRYERQPQFQEEESEPKNRNTRNGHSRKGLKTSFGETRIEVPRDRQGSFEPRLIPKHQRVSQEIAERIIALYGSGMTTTDLARHISEMYGIAASSSLISRVVESVDPELRAWRNRPLESIALVLYVDALHVKVRQSTGVVSTAIYIASGYMESGHLEVLGIWTAPEDSGGHGERSTFWHEALHQLRNRGLQTVLLACSDDLAGLQSALSVVWPRAVVLPCVVHLMRSSLRYVPHTRRKEIARDLKTIYQAQSYEMAEAALEEFEADHGQAYPSVVRRWQSKLGELAPLWQLSPMLRKVAYTTNPLENINRQIRKAIKTRSLFPSNDSALRLITMVLRQINARAVRKGTRPDWPAMIQEAHALFGDQLPEEWGHRLRA
jgi:putative transposase